VLFGGAVVLLPVTPDILHVGSPAWSWLLAARSIGAVAAITLAHLPSLRRPGRPCCARSPVWRRHRLWALALYLLSFLALAIAGAADNVGVGSE
jgi:hypothetical protein